MEHSQGLTLLSLVTLMILATPVHSAKQYLYFSDYNQCDQTVTVARDATIQIEAKRASEAGDTAFTGCALLFRAGNMGDKLCMKITTLTFTNNKLQFQYFKTLEPTGATPARTYDFNNRATPPMEVCDNEYEISMKLNALDATAQLNQATIMIEVYNMQGNQRMAYMDRDCGITYKLSNSMISVQNTNPDGPNTLQSVCQLYFDYVGTGSNKICISFQKTGNTCGYELKVRDGGATASTLAHTYTCNNATPQRWCAQRSQIQLELSVTGNSPLPVGVFAVEVKDEAETTTPAVKPENSSGAPRILALTLIASVMTALFL